MDDITLYHAWGGDPAKADGWWQDVQREGLQANYLINDVDDPSPRLQYVYLFHPGHNPTQDGFLARPTVAVELPADDVLVSRLDDGLKEQDDLEYGWKEAWEDRLIPYEDWNPETADTYAGIEFVVPDRIGPDHLAAYHPDGLPAYQQDETQLFDGQIDAEWLFED